jgi:hypothetical protein
MEIRRGLREIKSGKNIQVLFPSSYEIFLIGGIFLVISLPGMTMIFVHHDAIFSNWVGRWGDTAIAGACVIGVLGIMRIVCGFRQSALPGTLVYRLTHLW